MWKDEIVDLITGSPGSWALLGRYRNTHPAPASFRSYLNICIPSHGIALTRALTGTHDLAIERSKWVGLVRRWRLCRMCHDDVEDVVHVLPCPLHVLTPNLLQAAGYLDEGKFPRNNAVPKGLRRNSRDRDISGVYQ
ncbi:hypothetical protein ARMGADRAFT_1082329 [Armillaria gallica]|uniref:Uncharacterized protein n=1 Tax=Armillaria gallica TaxID=47427 RepID=A0A2H3D7D0_ARMGA|nr:hypothetical protein ARMGADRAFT_1082329 [Armillaria gallica]